MMWFPQGDYAFFRLCEAPLSMPWLAPDGATMITADIGAAVGDERWTMADDDLIALTVDHFARVCPDAHARCIGGTVLRQPLGYPVFHRSYEPARQRLEQGTGHRGPPEHRSQRRVRPHPHGGHLLAHAGQSGGVARGSYDG